MDNISTPTEQFDDTFLEKNDKLELLNHIKHLYNTKFGWADDTLMKAMIKYHYNLTVGKINKDDYLEEKSRTDSLEDFLKNLG